MSASLLEPEVGDERGIPSTTRRALLRRMAASAQRVLPRAHDAIALLWLTVFHHVLGVKYRFAAVGYDEHYFLSEGWAVFKGQVPYRDFQEFKPPVIFFVHALGLKLFGLEGLGYRTLLSILSLAGFLALTVALLSRGVHRLLVVAALMLMIGHFYDDGLHTEVINEAETLALDFFMLGTGVLLTRTTWLRTQLVLGGALLTLSPLSKEPMVFPVVAAWVTLLFLQRSESDDTGAVWRFVLFTIGGVVGVVGTWLGYMLVTHSLDWYILQLKLNIAYTKNYAYQLRWAKRNPEGGELAEMYRRLSRVYLNVDHLGVFAPFFIGLGLLSGQRRTVGVGALLTFLAALYAVSIGSGYGARYFIMALAGTYFCVVLGSIAMDAYARRSGRDSAWSGAACLVLALVLLWPRFSDEWTKYSSYKPAPPPVPKRDIDFVHSHTSPGDTIFTTDDPLLCVYSDRLNAFRGGIVLDEIIEYYPGNTDEERLSVIRQGLLEKRPKLIVFGNKQVSARRKRRYMKALVMPFLRDGGYVRLNDRFYVRPD